MGAWFGNMLGEFMEWVAERRDRKTIAQLRDEAIIEELRRKAKDIPPGGTLLLSDEEARVFRNNPRLVV